MVKYKGKPVTVYLLKYLVLSIKINEISMKL